MRRERPTYLARVRASVALVLALLAVGAASAQVGFTFTPEQQVVPQGGQVCVPVVVKNFQGILKLDVEVNFDPTVLRFDSIRNSSLLGLDEFSYELPAPLDPSFRIDWLAEGFANRVGETLPDGTVLMELCFTAKGEPQDFSGVWFTTNFRFGNNNPDPIIFNERSSGRDIGLVANAAVIAIASLPLEVSLGDAHAAKGEAACVPVYAGAGFTDVRALNARVQFNVGLLNFIGAANFNPKLGSFLSGKVAQLFTGSDFIVAKDSLASGPGVTLDPGEKLFDLCFGMKIDCIDRVTHPNPREPNLFVEFLSAVSTVRVGPDLELRRVRGARAGRVDIERCNPDVLISSGKAYGAVGDIVLIENYVSGFHDVTRFDVDIGFDAANIRAVGVTISPSAPANFTAANIDLSTAASGVVRVRYQSATPQSFPDVNSLFAIEFELVGPVNSITYIVPDADNAVLAVAGGTPARLIVENIGGNVQFGVAIILTSDPVEVRLGGVDGVKGSTVCVDITVDNFIGLTKFRQGFSWDASVLRLVEARDLTLPTTSDPTCFRRAILRDDVVDGRGYFGIDWFVFGPDLGACEVTLPNGSSIVKLCFEIIGDSSQCSPIVPSEFPNNEDVFNFSKFYGVASQPIPTGGYVNEGFICSAYENGFALELPARVDIGADTTCFSVSVADYRRIEEWRVTLGFDSTLFQLVDVKPTFKLRSLAVTPPEPGGGRFSLAMKHKGPANIFDASNAFDLCFTARPGAPACAPIDSVLLPVRPYVFANRRERNLIVRGGELCRVNDFAPITVAATVGDISCDGRADGTIVLTAMGGGGPLVYAWSGAGVNPTGKDQSGLAPGSYTVVVTDPSGWVAPSTRTFVVGSRGPAPVARAGVDVTGACNSMAPLPLDGSASSVPTGSTVAWRAISGDAGVSSGGSSLSPLISGAGAAELTITSAGGCRSLDTAVVSRVTSKTVNVEQRGDLTCDINEVRLRGSITPASSNVTYAWTTVDGVLPTGSTSTLTIVVAAPGTYTLSATDEETGCTGARDFVVRDLKPSITLSVPDAPDTLSCVRATVSLSVRVTSAATELSYAWSTPNGRLLGPTDQSTATADRVGEYVLIVRDRVSGCTERAVLVVDSSYVAPVAVAGPDTLLTCRAPQVQLAAAVPGARQYRYAWSGPAGGLGSDPGQRQVSATRAGTYTVRVTDVRNGCEATDAVEVREDFVAPVVEAGTDRLLGCDTTEVRLTGTASSRSGDHRLRWTTRGGQFRGGTDGPSAVATQPGVYFFTATDSVSGCEAVDSLRVTQRTTAPQADAGPVRQLDCVRDRVTLAGSGSGGSGFGVSWTTVDGQIEPGTEGLFRATALAAGSYTLTVTDRSSGCVTTSTTVVIVDRQTPRVALPDTVVGRCDRSAVTLVAGGDAVLNSGNYTFTWRGPGGEVLPAGASTSTTLEGRHELRVRRTATGCDTTLSTVVAFAKRPTAAFSADTAAIICGVDSVGFQVSAASLASGQTISWLRNGQPTTAVRPAGGGPTGRYLTAEGGDYRLVLTSADGTCVTESGVVGVADLRRTLPVDVGPDRQFTCRETVVEIAARGEANPAWRYDWRTDDANPIENADQLAARFRFPGVITLFVTDPATKCTGSDELVLSAPDRAGLRATLPEDFTLSCDETRELTLDYAVPQGPASLSWTSSAQPGVVISIGDELSVSAPGTYYAEVTDEATGCATVDSVRVTQATPFTIAAIPTRQLGCDESTASITSSVDNPSGLPLRYRWVEQSPGKVVGPSDGASAVLEAGRYELRVEEVGGNCEAVAAVVVLGPGIPAVEAGPDVVLTCAQATRAFEASGTTSSNYQISWSTLDGEIAVGTANQLAAVATRPGLYTLTIRNTTTGCERSDEARATLDTLRPAATLADTVWGNCAGGAVAAAVAGAAFGDSLAYTFEWRDASSAVVSRSASASLPDAGEYELRVRGKRNGCETFLSTVVAYVARPPAQFSADTTTFICGRDSIALRISPASMAAKQLISWSLSNGDVDAVAPRVTSDPAVYLATSKGRYRLVLTAPDTSCVTVSPPTELFDSRTRLDVNAGSDLRQTCRDSIVVADATDFSQGVWRLQWDGPTGAPIGSPSTARATFRRPGTYRLTATDPATKCTGADQIEVLPPDRTGLAAELPADFTLGCGERRTLAVTHGVATGPASFRWWEGGAAGATLSTVERLDVSVPGTYVVSVTDEATGCIAVDSVVVDQVTGFALGTVPTYEMTCVDTVVSVSVSVQNPSNLKINYRWTAQAGGEVVGPSDRATARLRAGVYTLAANDAEGSCADVRTVTVAPYDGPRPEAVATYEYDGCTQTLTLSGNESDTTRGVWRLLQGTLPGLDLSAPDQMFTAPATGPYRLSYQVKPEVCPISPATVLEFVIEREARVNVYDRVEEASAKTTDTTIQIVPSAQANLVARVLSADSATVSVNAANRLGIRDWTARELNVTYEVCDRNCLTRCDTAELVLLRGADTVVSRIPEQDFPNTITPNGDGRNDVFIIEPLLENPGLYPNARLTIINRWGTILFNAQPYNNDFGGNSDQGGVIPNGTYYYVFMLDPLDGEVYKGHLTIIR